LAGLYWSINWQMCFIQVHKQGFYISLSVNTTENTLAAKFTNVYMFSILYTLFLRYSTRTSQDKNRKAANIYFHCGVWIEGYLFNLFCETFKCSRIAHSWTSFLHISTIFQPSSVDLPYELNLLHFNVRSLTRNY